MKLDWRNILGFAGLVTLFVWGPTLIQKVRNASMWPVLPSILQGYEAQNLILLGVVIVVVLLLVRRMW